MISPLLILFQLLSLSLSQSSVEYIITPNNIPSCHNCFTVEQFASNVSHHLNDNTTLILQPGSHELSVGLVVSNITSFTMQYTSSEPGNTLQCNQSGKILFDSVQHVYIRNIILSKCFGSKLVNVGNCTLSNTSFIGSFYAVLSGTALEIVRSTAILSNCSFTKYYYGTYRWTISSIPYDTVVHRAKKWIGGALIITHSTITIVEGNFTENRAQTGGAIYAENHSIITIIKSNFIFNTANSSLYTPDKTAAGGAVYVVNNCSVFLNDSYFHNNQVYYGYRLGGSIAVYQGIIYITGSMLSNSRAQKGAALYLSQSIGVFNLSNISGSRAIDEGGVLYSVNSSLGFYHSRLVSNIATRGGALLISKSITVIENCSFVGNSAIGRGDGGVIYAMIESGLAAKSCHFKNNFAEFGAVMYIESTSQEIRIEKCTFLYNRAEFNGGVFYFNREGMRTTLTGGNKRTNVVMKESKFLNNEAGTAGGVMHSINSNFNIEDRDNIYHSNQAKDGGVMQISNCTLEASNINISFNTAFREGIVSLSNSRATYTGTVTFHNNLASAIIVSESEIHFHGSVNFSVNEDMDSKEQLKGGAITSTLSILTFSDKVVFSKNRADDGGGAICSINSIIHVLGNAKFLNNWAIKGGGMYLYQSELLCKNEISFIENHANISGGGIHSLNSFIRLSSGGSLLYMRNSAELGGGIFLTRNSKINVQGFPVGSNNHHWERTNDQTDS